MMTEPSEKYYRALHLTQQHHENQQKTFSGQFAWKHRHRIKAIIDRLDVKSILDFGCGKGKQYRNIDEDTGQSLEQYWGISPFRYDPGVREYSKEPTGKFDLVICVQVLGSIPTDDLPWVIDRLYGFATKAIFVTLRLIVPHKPIYESLGDSMPIHLTQEEWMEKLCRPDEEARMIAMFKGGITPGWKTVEF